MMLGGSGVDGAIHRAAGDELRKACKAHKEISYDVRLPIGRSRILLSYNLSKTTYYIINTSGPRYDDFSPAECQKYLTSCYETSLALANLYDLETIGFTAISCGIFGYVSMNFPVINLINGVFCSR
jgi:O-acetyl-ADP-ribose deacetylase (regulator of RNase III)